jgi:hypothetical protein
MTVRMKRASPTKINIEEFDADTRRTFFRSPTRPRARLLAPEPKRKNPRRLSAEQQALARRRRAAWRNRQDKLRRPDSIVLARGLLKALAKSTKAEITAADPILKRWELILADAGWSIDQARAVMSNVQKRLKRA